MTEWKVVSPWRTDQLLGDELILDYTRSQLSDDEADKVVSYLRSGHVVFRNTEKLVDPLGDTESLVVPLSLLTDGEWIWEESLTYFVAEHNFCPPDHFMSYLRERNFEPRTPSREQAAAVSEALQAED